MIFVFKKLLNRLNLKRLFSSNSFKLLGVTIDNKLNFAEHSSNVKKLINRKLYSIKCLFYLSTKVKIQFFKTFILPYFDYCSSLLIYCPKSTIQSLNNCFNLCLLKLFKLKPEKLDLEDLLPEDIQEIVMNNFEDTLQNYGLITFQKRLLDRFLLFAHSILNKENSPPDLKETIKLPDISSAHDPKFNPFDLRKGVKIRHIVPETKYEHLTFRFFFPKLISKLKHKIDFTQTLEAFIVGINFFSRQLQRIFLENFSKFSVTYFTSFKRKVEGRKKR